MGPAAAAQSDGDYESQVLLSLFSVFKPNGIHVALAAAAAAVLTIFVHKTS